MPEKKIPWNAPGWLDEASGWILAQLARNKLQLIAERSELTGLKGFCPVVLRDERDLKDARPQFQAEFEGQTYNFSSADAQARFEANPALYAPAAGGQDVVLGESQGERIEGSLDHAVWYKGRLFLFKSAESREAFEVSPADYAAAPQGADDDDEDDDDKDDQ